MAGDLDGAKRSGRVVITQRKSTIGGKPATRRTMRALGLRKIGRSVTHEDSPSLRGMIRTVQHLIEVTEGKS
jgi:large subunit ribosomal protein L30